jgi:glycosyltransferase involved in cell wall biosynthesis
MLGRTLWDRAHAVAMDRDVRYYHVGELLRAPFYQARWDCEAVCRHIIYTNSAAYPLKGFHVLLDAAKLLVRDFPDLQIRVPGAALEMPAGEAGRWWVRLRPLGYRGYLMRRIRDLGLAGRVVALGSLDAGQVAAELTQASVFVLPSFVENLSNSRAEATVVGTPCVTAFCGGVQSAVTDEETALCFPPGDAAVLAEQVRRLFRDRELAMRLSASARSVALQRHAPQLVVSQLINAYESETARHQRCAEPKMG